MKLVKSIVIGTVITAGALMMYSDGMINKKKMMRKGRQLVRKIGNF